MYVVEAVGCARRVRMQLRNHMDSGRLRLAYVFDQNGRFDCSDQ